MPVNGNSSRHTVQPDSLWRSQKLLFLGVFAVTGLVVYRWGLAASQRPRPPKSYTSTATVRLQGDLHAAADPESIKQHITCPQHIYRAVRKLGLSAKPPTDEPPQATADRVIREVSRALEVTTDGSSRPGELAVSIAYTHRSPQYSVQLANVLAETFADLCRTEWKRRTHRAYTEARKASQRAEQELLQAKARLDEFSRQHFGLPHAEPPARQSGEDTGQTEDGRAASAALRESDSPAATPATRPKPSPGDNPEWTDLSERLAVLKRRRVELLLDRTAAHPAVRDAEERIAELTRQLAETPRRLSQQPSGRPAGKNQSPQAQGPTETSRQPPELATDRPAPNAAETARQFRELKQAVDRATEVYRQAVQLERQAWEAHQQEPQIALDLAEPARAAAAPAPHRFSLLWAALAASLAVTAGAGMISAGAAVDPALMSVEQVGNVLPAPVVGTVPETNPAARPGSARRRRPLVRMALVITGLALIAGCAALLRGALGGF